MDLSNKPLTRVLCAEPLEGRWLLSAAPARSIQPAASPGSDITIDWERVAEEGEDGDAIISTDQLPPSVLDAFRRAHPDARITEVEREEEDGTEYGIAAEEQGTQIDVTLNANGAIVETETFIPESAILTTLPQAVLDVG